MEAITPTNFRKNMFQILKDIIKENKIQEITVSNDDGIILVPKKEWNRIQEELYLEETGTLDEVFDRMKDSTDDNFVEL